MYENLSLLIKSKIKKQNSSSRPEVQQNVRQGKEKKSGTEVRKGPANLE
jgi:hypothetical protein